MVGQNRRRFFARNGAGALVFPVAASRMHHGALVMRRLSLAMALAALVPHTALAHGPATAAWSACPLLGDARREAAVVSRITTPDGQALPLARLARGARTMGAR